MRRLVSIVCCASMLCASPAALAQPKPDAGGEAEGRSRFTRGIDLYKEGNFHAALAEFRAAYAAAPSWRIQYNLGQTLYQLQDYAGALAAFERYLAEGADKIEPARKAEVDGEIAKLRQRVASITVLAARPGAAPPPAELVVDDESKGTFTDKLSVVVSAGRHTFTASAPGYRSATRVLDVAGSTRIVLQLPLEPLSSAAAPVVAKPVAAPVAGPPAEPPHKSRWPLWLGLSLTGAAAAGTVTFAILAKSEHGKFERGLATPNVSADSLNSTRNAVKTDALMADILGATTIGFAVFTLVAGIVTMPDSAPAKAARLQPLLGPGGAGLRGTF